METKKCRQCGEIQPIANFRPYYSGSGTYTICKTCEKINSRAKYLTRKGDGLTEAEGKELSKITQLYELQRMCGLKPPRRSDKLQSKVDELERLLKAYADKASTKPEIPEELQRWLTEELTETPEYYLEDVYEPLKEKFRPMLRVDNKSLVPQYDETYSTVLGQILDRFFKYEDDYYQKGV